MTLVVGIFHAAYGEASGLVASLPYFQTLPVTTQMAKFTVRPPRRGLIAILAGNRHACSCIHVTFSIQVMFERFLTAGTTVSAALLFDWPSSSTRPFDKDAGRWG